MAITTALCNSFKQELLNGTHNLPSNTIKLALIKVGHSGTYNKSSTNYSNITDASDEATNTSGSAYPTGGVTLDSVAVSLSGDTAIVDIADEVITSASISAVGCMIYNSSQSNKAIATIDFSGTQTATSGNFTITFPAADASNAIIRIA